ncbi:1-acyl-sn-glycerol-3-phosphate acyltransferase [Fusibacter paucivorans]|uniref:1-acyl-sn-glycerol-3-phosphate acyltransferase n=1 Tax=Fusibacter paucivorans TaxID=76009 RepID=A0ABS5PTJ2_9FIRM|nr:lysophospholipid acyltransferase family protein [Fusibacter paucivorans]MBS7527704.1 1-acyl-sn-glycerol-3-phosphate acyltransferase [Fusibacter paucivorans]
MLRTIIWFVYFWASLISYVPSYLKLKDMPNDEARLIAAERKARHWSEKLLKLAGTQIEVKGLDHLPKDGPILFIANHQSNFDIPLMIASLPVPVGFVAKLELEKMPFVNGWMKALQCTFIDRSDIRKQVRAINEGAVRLKKGYHIVLFPEGTRSADGKIQDFKPGGLKLATKSGAAIVPITIDGSIGIMQKGSLKINPATVTITIHPRYEMESKDTVANMAAIKQQIGTIIEARSHGTLREEQTA